MTHYEKTNETELLMEAYYYMGRANDDLKETLKAQDYYLKALEAGKDSDNRKLLTRICYNVGSLYLYQDVHEQAIKYLKEALKYTDSEKDSTAQSYVLRDIARCFSTQNNQDSALVYYTEALKYSDSADEIYILNELGSTYRRMKDYQKSYLYLQKAKQIIPETDKEKFRHIYLNVGLVHLETNHFDSATIYMEEAAKSRYMPTKASAQHFLYKLAKLQGNTERALLYIEYAKLLNDSIYQDNKSNSLRKAQAIYDYNQAKNAINKLKLAHISSESSRYRAWAITGTATLAFIILITVSVFLFKYLKKRNTDLKSQLVDFKQNSDTALKNNMARIGELEAIIAKSSNEIERIIKENETLKKEQEKRKASAGILENSSVYKKHYLAIQIIKKSKHDTYVDIGITSEDKEELKELIESLYPHFALRIMQYFPSISEVELHLCYLCKIGITSPSIRHHSPERIFRFSP
ncbi:tetratricopeptide repeat protein [Bacteroides sp. OttesenSCG-928-D19]|nr:tetratricopeptide repeat protein [Bacteroides sp. OttesenSCG-928-D19]